MNKRDGVSLSSPDILALLRESRSAILKADGDRDYMNPSNLTVQQTMAISDYISMAIHAFAVASEEIMAEKKNG
jgi:hypothetical protein